MKGLLVFLSITMLATPALAISRYNSRSMTCDEVHRRIAAERAVILRYPSTRVAGMTLYDRYVSNAGMCGNYEYPQRFTVPTSDRPNCPVYACKPPVDEDDLFIYRRRR